MFLQVFGRFDMKRAIIKYYSKQYIGFYYLLSLSKTSTRFSSKWSTDFIIKLMQLMCFIPFALFLFALTENVFAMNLIIFLATIFILGWMINRAFINKNRQTTIGIMKGILKSNKSKKQFIAFAIITMFLSVIIIIGGTLVVAVVIL